MDGLYETYPLVAHLMFEYTFMEFYDYFRHLRHFRFVEIC